MPVNVFRPWSLSLAVVLTSAALLLSAGCKSHPDSDQQSNAPARGTSKPGAPTNPSVRGLAKTRETAVAKAKTEGPPARLERLLNQPQSLQLTKGQQAKLKAVHQASEQRLSGLKKQVQTAQKEAEAMAAKSNSGGPVTLLDVRKKLSSNKILTNKLEAERAKDWQKAMALLTPEQRVKASKLKL